MPTFDSVNVKIAANVYFNGNVTSRTIEFPDGSIKTLGIMRPGEYLFDTGKPELMEITSGQLSYLLSGETEWKNVGTGESFNVPGDSSFQLKVTQITDYVCSFLE